MIRRGLLSISMLLLLLLLSIFTLQYHALVQPLLPSRKILARSLQVVAPFRPKKQCHQTVARKNVMKLQVLASDDDDKMLDKSDLQPVAFFLLKAALVGVLTGLSVVLFKSAIAKTSSLFYENLADILPKPSFYWPLALCKLCVFHSYFGL